MKVSPGAVHWDWGLSSISEIIVQLCEEGAENTPQQVKLLNIFLSFLPKLSKLRTFGVCFVACDCLLILWTVGVWCPLICYLFSSMSCLSCNLPTLPFFKGKYGFKNCDFFNILLFHAEANFTTSCFYWLLLPREHPSWSLNKAFINVSWLIFKHHGGM